MHFVLFKKYLNGNDIFKFINPNDLEDFQRQLSTNNKIKLSGTFEEPKGLQLLRRTRERRR